MTPLEVLAAHRERDMLRMDVLMSVCDCGWRGLTTDHPAHVLDALTQAGHVVVQAPEVAHKGPHDTDASAFRQAAWNLDHGYKVGGSCVRDAVSTLLRRVAGALTDDPRTTSELRRAGSRAAAAAETGGKA